MGIHLGWNEDRLLSHQSLISFSIWLYPKCWTFSKIVPDYLGLLLAHFFTSKSNPLCDVFSLIQYELMALSGYQYNYQSIWLFRHSFTPLRNLCTDLYAHAFLLLGIFHCSHADHTYKVFLPSHNISNNDNTTYHPFLVSFDSIDYHNLSFPSLHKNNLFMAYYHTVDNYLYVNYAFGCPCL